MNKALLNRLRCPQTGQRLHNDGTASVLAEDGWLITEDGLYRYPIRNGIPRFVPEENYASNFGMQWNYFSKTQLDSFSGYPISRNRFMRATGWTEKDLSGKWVLDVGCGSGRFAEIALSLGANVVALDYSTAVDACFDNLKEYSGLHVLQGDIYALPFELESFDFIYSLGVLQHTPEVSSALTSLPAMLKSGGKICVDVYWSRFRTMMHVKYLLRPLTKRMHKGALFRLLEILVPPMLKTSQFLGSIPLLGKFLKRIIPVADYTGIYPLTSLQLKEWALLDTFDMLAPEFDNPQTVKQLRMLLTKAGIVDIEIFHEGMLVGRGHKL
jgi:2-polyprenyl-3-methyl-5-hydroxy-6-metoxy-1,4-benzoquinol methylase